MIRKLKKISSHSVARNSIALFALQFVSMVAPLIVFPYLSRVLGIDGFGIIMLVLSASAIGLVITDYGFNLSATYKISKNREDIDYVSQLIGAIFFIKLISLSFLSAFTFFWNSRKIKGFLFIKQTYKKLTGNFEEKSRGSRITTYTIFT